MGYRYYIGKISKEEYNTIKNASSTKEVYEKLGRGEYWENDETYYIPNRKIVTELHNFGKYVNFPNQDDYFKPFFLNEDLQREYEGDHHMYIVDREFFELVIKDYRDTVHDFYAKMINPICGSETEDNFFENIVTRKLNIDTPRMYDFDFKFDELSQEQKNALYEIIMQVREMGSEWGVNNGFFDSPLNLDLDKPEITHSWKYEYATFELTRIYKEFDWDNDILVYYGW